MTSVWSTSCHVRYEVCNITVKLKDEFRYRWNNYKDNSRKSLRGEDHKHAGFFAHFQTAGHNGFINNTETRFIDKTDPSDPTRHEDFWIDTLKTRYPQGLNNIDPNH